MLPHHSLHLLHGLLQNLLQ